MINKMMPALLVVSTCTVPLGCIFPEVPPTMLKINPTVMRSCRMRKYLSVTVAVDFALTKLTLCSVSPHDCLPSRFEGPLKGSVVLTVY